MDFQEQEDQWDQLDSPEPNDHKEELEQEEQEDQLDLMESQELMECQALLESQELMDSMVSQEPMEPQESQVSACNQHNCQPNEYFYADQHATKGYRPIPAPRLSKVVSQSSSVTRSKPLGHPPSFDGSGDITVFKLLFQEWADLNGWENDDTITLWLKQCRTGSAKMSILYYHITDSKTLFKKLDNLYVGYVLIQTYSDLLEKRVKQPNECLTDLANDIQKMVEVIYADCDGYIRDNMAISYFVRALPNNHNYQI